MSNTDTMSNIFKNLTPEHQSYALAVLRALVYAQEVPKKPLPPSDADAKNTPKSA